MLDVKLIREDPEKVKKGIAKKKADPKLIDKFLRLDEEWRLKTKALEDLSAEQNVVSRAMSAGQSQDLLSKAQLLKQRITEIESERDVLSSKRDDILNKLPNIPFDDVPVGKDETENKILREVGKKKVFRFEPKDYLTLAEQLKIIDVKKAAEISGSRFNYLLRDGALLEFALIKLAFDTLVKEGFIPVVTPVLIKPEVYRGMGRLAANQKEDRYYLPKDELYLIGSTEHTIGPLHMNDVIPEEELPKRYVGFSTWFRREAGSYGKDIKGILRSHQFDGVEMYSFVKPEDSEKEHAYLVSLQEKLVQALELPYRVMEICTGDMGWTDARQTDVEIWMPGQGTYRETHSCDANTTFQSSGINAKYKAKSGKKEFVHTLDATAFAIGRMLIAIIENYQTEDGGVEIPKVLRDYLGKSKIEP